MTLEFMLIVAIPIVTGVLAGVLTYFKSSKLFPELDELDKEKE